MVITPVTEQIHNVQVVKRMVPCNSMQAMYLEMAFECDQVSGGITAFEFVLRQPFSWVGPGHPYGYSTRTISQINVELMRTKLSRATRCHNWETEECLVRGSSPCGR